MPVMRARWLIQVRVIMWGSKTRLVTYNVFLFMLCGVDKPAVSVRMLILMCRDFYLDQKLFEIINWLRS